LFLPKINAIQEKRHAVEDFIIYVYCCVDEAFLHDVVKTPLRKRGFAPNMRKIPLATQPVNRQKINYQRYMNRLVSAVSEFLKLIGEYDAPHYL